MPPKKTLNVKVGDFFKKFSTKAKLKILSKEVQEGSVNTTVNVRGQEQERIRRGKSQTLLDGIHDIVADHKLVGCKNAESPCLLALVKQYMDEKNGIKIIDGLAKILPVLYTKPNILAGKYSLFNTTIQRMFPNTKIAEHSKDLLHLDLEAATLRRTDYAAKVFAQHGQQRQLLDSEVLERINTLRTKTDCFLVFRHLHS